MTSERRTKLTDALVRVLRRFLTPIGVTLPGAHDGYMRDSLLALAGHGDGHVLTVALLLAILTGRSDLCTAGVFGAGKTRSLAVLLIALSCELDDFYAIVYTKENVAAKALADQISDLPHQHNQPLDDCKVVSRKERAKRMRQELMCDAAIATELSRRSILIATGGSATAEMAMKYSSFSLWLSRAWLAFMDESQQSLSGAPFQWGDAQPSQYCQLPDLCNISSSADRYCTRRVWNPGVYKHSGSSRPGRPAPMGHHTAQQFTSVSADVQSLSQLGTQN